MLSDLDNADAHPPYLNQMITLKRIAEHLQIEHPSALQVSDYLQDAGVGYNTYVACDYDEADDDDCDDSEQADD